MSAQTVTPELKAWIVAQATSGVSAEASLEAMRQSGWEEDVAIAALESTLTEHLARINTPPVPVPQVKGGLDGTTIEIDGHEIGIVASLHHPRVVVFSNLLTPAECDEIIALGSMRLARSETVETETGSSEVSDARTSDGMFFERGEFEVCARIEARIATLLGWPVENGEGLQVLRYRPGAEYKPHYDYFDPERPGTPAILKRGGQRVASLVCYLNTPDRGGATIFPDVGLAVAPIRGNAVFFSYDRPHPSTRSLHGGAPVIEGEKWVATKWLRERRFD
ncbi:2OG-Fe(II) oxygenase [Piscinibacter koreensis]|uniref:2OG-Fe(II) oxygenase n=1 Tax=Piscinibacter koreensis TaxID=2742824 RepID=A0A7Y6TVV1_9BURK|nr:2OG-Fe(II) oxygenase [Schlegelella koreensis]NUZ05342.1 2OG-Fe(II) oxygenase [Schlegelella koreensis]